MALSFDISPSNNCVAFGDEHSGISLYCASGRLSFFHHHTTPRILPLSPPISLFPPLLQIYVVLWLVSIQVSINQYLSCLLGATEPTFTLYPRETEFPQPLPTYPSMRIDDPNAIYSSIPLPHLPPDQTQYASDNWPERLVGNLRNLI